MRLKLLASFLLILSTEYYSQFNAKLLTQNCWEVYDIEGLEKTFMNVKCNSLNLKQYRFLDDGKMYLPKATISPNDMSAQIIERNFRKWKLSPDNKTILMYSFITPLTYRYFDYKILVLDSLKLKIKKVNPKN